MYSTPPTSISAARTIRSTASITSVRRRVALDLQAGASAHRAGKLRAASSTPSVVWQMSAGQRLKLSPCGKDFDRVEILAAERFDARDVAAARRDVLLHQRRTIDAEIDRPGRQRRGPTSVGRVVTHDARAAAADVRFHHHRKAQITRRCCRLRRMIDYARARVGKSQRLRATRVAEPSRSRSRKLCGR